MASSHLPQSEAALLVRLHQTDMSCLRSRVRQLRDAGWTLRAIGEPVNAPRPTVRSWENHADASKPSSCEQEGNLPPLPTPPGIRPAFSFPEHPATPHPRVRALPIDVPEVDRGKIANLAPLARRVRGGTPQNSAYRQAKEELNELLAHYDAKGVPTQRLAELAGVTYRAMKIRLEEYYKQRPLSHRSGAAV